MFLKFDAESCKDCYACLRSCPVKAIKFINEKAEIVEEECVLCGKCVNICPQNAKKVTSDVENVKQLIKNNPDNVALIVAPAFIANFEVENFTSFADACKKLGFVRVDEVAIGAHYVSKEYKKLLAKGEQKVYFSTACPSSVDYVRKHYPDALKYLTPIVSPMVAIARIIKQKVSRDMHIVFVGPCIAKKKEVFENQEIDYALTFEELTEMLNEREIKFEKLEEKGEKTSSARYYPISRGIIKSFEDDMPEKYDSIAIDGVERLKDALTNIDELDHIFIEMNMCEGGCINGPAKISNTSLMKDNATVRRYARSAVLRNPFDEDIDVDFSTSYSAIPSSQKMPTEEEIKKILAKVYKFKKEDETNCGACGYPTCRAKAIAVYNGYADPEYCLPYLKNKAESLSNEVIQHSPNAIISVNKDGIILDVNDTAINYLCIQEKAKGKHYDEILDLPEIMVALMEERNIQSVTVYNEKNNMYFDVSITFVKEQNIAFAIYKDITQETLNDEKMRQLRQEMIKVTDDVINHQMVAVQEIASLLGESTAQAKIALINFKNTLKDEG